MKSHNIVLAIVLLKIADALWKNETLVPRLAEATSRAGERFLPEEWTESGRIFTMLARWDGESACAGQGK